MRYPSSLVVPKQVRIQNPYETPDAIAQIQMNKMIANGP